jgi:hypothetical protein
MIGLKVLIAAAKVAPMVLAGGYTLPQIAAGLGAIVAMAFAGLVVLGGAK